jgi:hypothetical protein
MGLLYGRAGRFTAQNGGVVSGAGRIHTVVLFTMLACVLWVVRKYPPWWQNQTASTERAKDSEHLLEIRLFGERHYCHFHTENILALATAVLGPLQCLSLSFGFWADVAGVGVHSEGPWPAAVVRFVTWTQQICADTIAALMQMANLPFRFKFWLCFITVIALLLWYAAVTQSGLAYERAQRNSGLRSLHQIVAGYGLGPLIAVLIRGCSVFSNCGSNACATLDGRDWQHSTDGCIGPAGFGVSLTQGRTYCLLAVWALSYLLVEIVFIKVTVCLPFVCCQYVQIPQMLIFFIDR